VGDSVGILPENNPVVVQEIMELLRASSQDAILDPKTQTHTSFQEFLLKKANLTKCTSSLLKRLEVEVSTPHELLDLLRHSTSKLSPQELCNLLLPLMPRFYSIASSPHMFPDEIHLTVASLTYSIQNEIRHGVGSHFLCHRAELLHTPIGLYVQPSNHFTLPSDPMTPIILVGPGTGVAPFRAFLQERDALRHGGQNWLFFGERNKATDFYYKDFFLELEKQKRLRLDTAFSRDGSEKVYVQHRMWQQRTDLWLWLQKGAQLYVCGDAEKMAKDVEATLLKIGCSEGGLTEEKSREWLKALRKERRYLQDVY
jgi:sulfite reductase (NADPH) flavoprotein alpha-component